jgi:hypothetical protein
MSHRDGPGFDEALELVRGPIGTLPALEDYERAQPGVISSPQSVAAA